MRAEDYGPARPSEELQNERRARGQNAVPPIAVVTGSVEFAWGHRFFTEAEERPIVVTTEDADPDRVARAGEVAEVIEAGVGGVDLPRAMSMLAARGIDVLLVEGGPSLNGQLLMDGLVDELHLTVAPSLVSGEAIRIARGETLAEPYGLVLAGILQDGDSLFLRYTRADTA